MRIKYIPLLLIAALSSCGDSKNDEPTISPSIDQSQMISLNVVSSGDKSSRSGRILTSSEATNDVDIVSLAIYRLDNGKTGEKVFSRNISWKDSVAALSDGQMVHINLRNAPELASTRGLDDGSYTVIATGYTNGHSFRFDPAVDNLSTAAPIPNAVTDNENAVEEIFAGSFAEIQVKDRVFVIENGESGFKIINLRRQVAGTFGYFSNIPSKGFDGTPATHLRLVASGENNLIRLGGFNKSDDVMSVVNGARTGNVESDARLSSGAEGYTVYETCLTDWFPNGDVTGDGVLNEQDASYGGMSGNWKVPSWLDGKISVKMGTIFCSNFIVPFLAINQPTFELQLIAKLATGGVTILRSWGSSVTELQKNIFQVEDNGTLKSVNDEETSTSYSILRNHIYSMGRKSLSKPNPGDDPDQVDDPENLSKGEIVVVNVNDNWEEHHRLIIKPQV